MRNLILQIITKSGEKFEKQIKQISNVELNRVMNNFDYSSKFSDSLKENEDVISFYKECEIDFPCNQMFDYMCDKSSLYAIDEVNTRWMLD